MSACSRCDDYEVVSPLGHTVGSGCEPPSSRVTGDHAGPDGSHVSCHCDALESELLDKSVFPSEKVTASCGT